MKQIGILGTYAADTGVLGVNRHYLEFFKQYGNVSIIMHDNEVIENLDLLVLPGGADVNPERYGQDATLFCQRPDQYKESFDLKVLPDYIALNTPLFGICRGLQTLAVTFGMSLEQHVDHDIDKYNRMRCSEKVTFPNSVAQRLGTKTIEVNSLHHQIVDTTSVINSKQGVTITAISSKYKTIEALEFDDYPAAGVQWHPELIYDIYSDNIITKLLN